MECIVAQVPRRTVSTAESATQPDMVNHPPHYASKTGLETIDVIEAFTDGLKGE